MTTEEASRIGLKVPRLEKVPAEGESGERVDGDPEADFVEACQHQHAALLRPQAHEQRPDAALHALFSPEEDVQGESEAAHEAANVF